MFKNQGTKSDRQFIDLVGRGQKFSSSSPELKDLFNQVKAIADTLQDENARKQLQSIARKGKIAVISANK